MKSHIASIEKTYYLKALKLANMDRDEAARLLGVSRANFFRKLKKHGFKFKVIVSLR